MKNLILILTLFSTFLTVQSVEAQRRFRGGRVVVVNSAPVVRPARLFIKPSPRRIAALPRSAKMVRHRTRSYHIANGFFYTRSRGAYVRAIPPRGLRVRTIPGRIIRLTAATGVILYANGTFYREIESGSYEIIAPDEGLTIPYLPEDADMVEVNGAVLYSYDDILYKVIETEEGESFKVVGTLDD